MSRKMKGFADYFLAGMQMGGQWANQWEAHAIARERNKLKQQSDAIRNAREDKKLALYGHGVMANADLARARAANVGKAKGGGGGAPVASADTAALLKEANDRGIVVTPQAAPAQTNITVTGGGNDGDGGGTSDVPQPPGDGGNGGGGVDDYAEGGIVEGMSLQEAKSYDTGFTPSSKPKQSAPAGGGLGGMAGALGKSIGKGAYDAYDKAKTKAKEVTPTGPKGTGEGGKYTVADSQPGGVLSTEVPPVYRAGGAVQEPNSGSWYEEGGVVKFGRGGAVRGYAEGGMVEGQDLTQGYDWKAAEKDREQKTQQAQTEQVAQQAHQQTEETERKKKASGDTGGNFGSSFASAFDGGSANGATGSGGDSTGGVSGTGGVGGSATDGSGGSAAAGTSGDAGSDGGGTYRRGGQVRRFQSGGRVMREQAIDTGTSGPGSGYGYRAAPPSRRY